MNILLGSHNPAKVDYFARQLEGYEVSFLTLGDLGLEKLPDEDGKSVLENAAIKAAYYGRFHDYVISADSALYIRELPLDDPRQPGLTIRRAADGHEMDEEEMISYYTSLVHSLGGKVTCWYQDAYAVCNHGKVFTFMDDTCIKDLYGFYLVDKPHPTRKPGWPLDSLSIRPQTGRYFVDDRELHANTVDEVLMKDYREKLVAFYEKSLGLKRREGRKQPC